MYLVNKVFETVESYLILSSSHILPHIIFISYVVLYDLISYLILSYIILSYRIVLYLDLVWTWSGPDLDLIWTSSGPYLNLIWT